MIISKIVLFFMIEIFGHLSATNEIINETDKDELVFAHVLYRHGNRSIGETYPNHPYKSERFWPDGFGELTTVGKQTQYELGRYLRKRYNDLIGPCYTNKVVYIRSTDVNRTLMSAECSSAGLFFPIGGQKWVDFINWQPVPVHTIPEDQDYLLHQTVPCPKIDKLHKEFAKSKEITDLLEKYDEFGKYLEAHSGMKIKSLEDYYKLYDPIITEHLRGLPLPDFAQNALKGGVLSQLSLFSKKLITRTTAMKKAKSGFLIKEILDRFQNKTLSLLDKNLKLYIYSAHDNTFLNTLHSLNLFKEKQSPPFASSVHFELYKRGHDYYVQIFYRTACSNYLPPMNIPNCGTKCPLKKLYQIYKDILPTADETYESLCRL